MPRSKNDWDAYFKRSDAKHNAKRKKRGVTNKNPASLLSTLSGLVLPRVVGEAPIFVKSHSKSHIIKYAKKRCSNPTTAEAGLYGILNSLKGGILRGGRAGQPEEMDEAGGRSRLRPPDHPVGGRRKARFLASRLQT
jgi:hypothetical protein